jgi:FAD:protein FMN transferase
MKYFFLLSAILLSLTFPSYSQKNPVKISGYAQGTTYSITYFDKKNRNFQSQIELILKNFDKSLSLWDSNSIICRVNRNEKNVIIDNYFRACFDKAMEVSKNTDGAFDITVAPLVSYWGFGLKNREKIDSSRVDSILKFVGYKRVELIGNTIIKADKRTSLDFNALAQGYSVDLVAQFLDNKGITNYIVEIGGEVYAKGSKPSGDSWKVGIETPADNPQSNNPLFAVASLKNKALSTSGNYRKFYVLNGKRYSHTINPHTGYPALNSLLSVSVFADNCISSDAYATAFMVLGLDESKQFLEKHPELQVYMIYSGTDGKYEIYQSPGLKDIVVKTE